MEELVSWHGCFVFVCALLIVVDMVVREGAFFVIFVISLCFLFFSRDANFVVIMNGTPPPCIIAVGT
jgi:hypothetical protein